MTRDKGITPLLFLCKDKGVVSNVYSMTVWFYKLLFGLDDMQESSDSALICFIFNLAVTYTYIAKAKCKPLDLLYIPSFIAAMAWLYMFDGILNASYR